MEFMDYVGDPCTFQSHCRIVYVLSHSEDIRRYSPLSLKGVKNEQM